MYNLRLLENDNALYFRVSIMNGKRVKYFVLLIVLKNTMIKIATVFTGRKNKKTFSLS